MSCAGNGYLAGNTLVPYPFEDGQEVPCGEEELLAIQRCFADAGIFIDSEAVPEGGWPSIGGFSVSSGALSFSLSVSGAETGLTVSSSGEEFPIVSGKASWGSYVLILCSEGIREISSPPSQGSSSPYAMDGDFFLRLCARCVTLRQAGLGSIMVYDGVKPMSSGPHFVLNGDVSIRPGNNMLLSETDGNGIEIGAVPGAGMGTVPCSCQSGSSAKKSISGPDGHVRIFNDTCYDLEPAEFGTVVVGGKLRRSRKLRIHAKCTACCQCSMYASIVNDRLVPLFNSVKKAKVDIEDLSDKYEEAVKKFNERMKKPTMDDITLSLAGMPIGAKLGSKIPEEKKVRGKMNRCAFTATLRNSSFFVIYATATSMSGTDSIAEVSASYSDKDGNPISKTSDSKDGIVGRTFVVYPGRSLVVSFVSVKKTNVNRVSTGGYSGSISFGISYDGGSIGSLEREARV